LRRAKKDKITDYEKEVAVKVLMQSKQVRKWVQSQAKFLGVDLNTPEGEIFWEREARAAAVKMIS